MSLIENGGMFEQPPAHAPREQTSPGSERATPEQIALAQAHEQELPPFAPKQLSREAVKAITGKYPEELAAVGSAPPITQQPTVATPSPITTTSVAPVAPQPFVSSRRRVMRPDVGQPTILLTDPPASGGPVATRETSESESGSHISAPVPVQLGQDASIIQQPLAPPEPHQRAASNTDSPSRGIPTFSADPNKQITGGFGLPGEGPGDYFPLDGTELRRVVETLLSEVHDRIQDDLRFSMACTYPRVAARVEVIIEAYGYDKPIVIPRVARAHDKTVLATAKAMADEVVFVVAAERAEFDAAGHPLTAPNRMRQEVGVEIPHKQRIRTPSGGSMWVDKSG